MELEFKDANNVEKIFGRTPKNAKFFYLVIDDIVPTCKDLVEKLESNFKSINDEGNYDIEIKGFFTKKTVIDFIVSEKNTKEYESVFAGICDLALAKGSTGREGIEILTKIETLYRKETYNDINNFHVFSNNVENMLKPQGYMNSTNETLFKKVRSVVEKGRGGLNPEPENKSFEVINVETEESYPNPENSKIKLGFCTDNETLVNYVTCNNKNLETVHKNSKSNYRGDNSESSLEMKLPRALPEEINDKIKRVSFKAILDENFERIECDPYEEVNDLLRKLLNQNSYHFVPQLINTLLYNPYTEVECLLNINGYTIFYQADYENPEFDNDLLSSDFIKYYNEFDELEQITIGGTEKGKSQYRFEDNSEISAGIIKLHELNSVYDKIPLNNLIITFFYIKGIVTRLIQNEESDEQGENILVENYNNILKGYEDVFVRKIINLEMACLLFEHFYKDETKRKRFTQSMNLPEIIDFYYCEIVEIEEGEEISKINIRNIENDFSLTESVFPTKKLVECGLEEGHCFKYIRFKEKEIINPFEGNNSYVIFPITIEMFDRK